MSSILYAENRQRELLKKKTFFFVKGEFFLVGGRRGQQTSQLDEIAVIIIVFPGVCILIQFDTPHLLVFLMWPFRP